MLVKPEDIELTPSVLDTLDLQAISYDEENNEIPMVDCKIILNSHYDGIMYDPIIYKDNDSKYNDRPMNYAIFNSDVNNLDCFNDITVNGFFCL